MTYVRLLLLLAFTLPLETFPEVLAECFLTSPAGKFNNSWLTSSIFSHLSLASLQDPLTVPIGVSAAAVAVGLVGGGGTVAAGKGAGGRGVLSISISPGTHEVPILGVSRSTTPRAAASTAG